MINNMEQPTPSEEAALLGSLSGAQHDVLRRILFWRDQISDLAPVLSGFPNKQTIAINELCEVTHRANSKWWQDIETGKKIHRNIGELLMLMVSELSEAMEGHRKGLPDDKLPHRSMFEVELADVLVRLFDACGGLGLDLGGAYVEKMAYNAKRADHKPENRKLAGGKKY